MTTLRKVTLSLALSLLDLVHAGLPVLREDFDDAGWVARSEGARLHIDSRAVAFVV
jgi:hypothetical protein